MSEAQENKRVEDNKVISMDYELTVDGEVVDSSKESGPIDFLQGHGNIIPGLESEIYGMEVDETREITVAAKDAYGEMDPARLIDIPKSEFPPEIELKPGLELQLRDRNGEILYARVDTIGEESVKLDFNHPLAGKDLHFKVTIVGIRDATDEEMAHGHAHG